MGFAVTGDRGFPMFPFSSHQVAFPQGLRFPRAQKTNAMGSETWTGPKKVVRKSLDKILDLGNETGWVIAYEPDTKDVGVD